MIRLRYFGIFCAVALLFPLSCSAAPRSYAAARTSSPIQIDSKLDEPAWSTAPWQSGFYVDDSSLGKSAPPIRAKVQTRFKVLYDDTAVYVAVQCDEPDIDAVKAVTPWRDGAVWQDDSVEIFFDPGNKGRYYHHIMVNSRGTIYDSYSADYGLVHDKLWNGDFRAAGHVDKSAKRWTVEVKIPYGAIVLGNDAGSTWKWNITRERHAGGPVQLSSWVPLIGSFHQPQLFGTLTGLPADYSAFHFDLREPHVDVARTGSGINTLKMKIGIRNDTGSAQRVRVRASLFGDQSKYVEVGPLSLHAGRNTTVTFPPLQLRGSAPNTNIVFALYNAQSGRMLKASVKSLSSEYKPIGVTLLRPCYRNNIYATQHLNEIVFSVELSAQILQVSSEVHYALMDAAGKTIVAGDAAGEALAKRIHAAIPELPVGAYQLDVSAIAAGGAPQAHTVVTIHKLPPPPIGNEVRIDRNRNLLVNGKPVFTIGWYGPVPTEDPRKDVVALQNIQTPVVPVYPDDGGIGKAFREHGIYSIVDVGNGRLFDSFKLWQKGKERLAKIRNELHTRTAPSDNMKELAKKLVDSVRGNLGLIGYYIADEPEIHDIPSAYLENYYKYLRKLDPYHPVFVTNDTVDGIVTHGYKCADVLNPDPYSSRWDYVPKFLKKINEVEGPGKTTYVTLWHASGQAHFTNKYGTAPPYSYRVFRNQYFVSVALGAKGFTAYTSAFFMPEIEYRYGLPYVWRELRFLQKAILAPAPSDPITVSGAPDMTVWGRRTGGHLYIIAVNHKPHARKAILHWALLRGHKRLIVMSEGRNVAVNDGSLSDSFAAGDVHIYTDDPRARSLPTVQSIRKELAKRKREAIKPGNLLYWSKGTKVHSSNDYYAPWFHQYYYYAINGITDDLGWYAYRWNKKSSWLELTMKRAAPVGRVVIYTPNLRDYQLDLIGPGGASHRATIENNGKNVIDLNFSPAVSCLKIRVTVTGIRNVEGPGAKGPLISEIEAYEKPGPGPTTPLETIAPASAHVPLLFDKVTGTNALWEEDFSNFQPTPKYYWKGHDTKWVVNPNVLQTTANSNATVTVASKSAHGYASMSHIFPYAPADRFFQVKLDSIHGNGYKFTNVGIGVSSGARGYRTAVNTSRPGIYTIDTHYVNSDFANGKNKHCFVTVGVAGAKKNPDGTVIPGPSFTFDFLRLVQQPENGLAVTMGNGAPLPATLKRGDKLHFELYLQQPAQDAVVETDFGPGYSPLVINGQPYVQLYRSDANGRVWVGEVTLGPGTGKFKPSGYPVVFKASITGGTIAETYASAAVAFE